jgi:hypothetical protein
MCDNVISNIKRGVGKVLYLAPLSVPSFLQQASRPRWVCRVLTWLIQNIEGWSQQCFCTATGWPVVADTLKRRGVRNSVVTNYRTRYSEKVFHGLNQGDNKEYLEKGRSRLAVQGQHQEPGIKCVEQNACPPWVCSHRTLISLTCEKWMVDS